MKIQSEDNRNERRIDTRPGLPGLLLPARFSPVLFSLFLLAVLMLAGCDRKRVYVTPKDMLNLHQQDNEPDGTESLTECLSSGWQEGSSESLPEGRAGRKVISATMEIYSRIDLLAAEDISEAAGSPVEIETAGSPAEIETARPSAEIETAGSPAEFETAGSLPETETAESLSEKKQEKTDTAGKRADGKDRIRMERNGRRAGAAPLPYTDGAHCLIPGWNLIKDMDLRAPAHTLGLLRCRLERILDSYEGTWSLAARDLQTGEKMVIQDIPMPSASIMKLFILGCLYEDFRTGRTARTAELVQRMNDMIRASSNTAANEIIRILGEGDYAAGIGHINEYIRSCGYSKETVIHNPFQEESLILDPEHHNQTTADDTAELLERVYRRSFAIRSACNETEQMLLESEMKYKLPSVLPEGISAANKTGETDEVENDAAIIFTPRGDYILTVFSTDWKDKSLAQQHFKEISAEAYRYFSSEDYGKKLYPYLKEAKEPVRQSDPAGPLIPLTHEEPAE